MSKKDTSFDFDDLDLAEICDQPFEFELKHPDTQKGLGVFVSVVGTESKTFQQHLRAEQNRLRKEAFEAERKGRDDNGPRAIEDDEQVLIKGVAAAMVGWRTERDGKSEPVIYWGGKPIEFSTDNAVKWMSKFRWVRPQINEQTADLGNFLRG